MSGVKLKNVSRSYDTVWAVEHIDVDIREGEFLTLLGPSGCGKTTTLRMVAGFLFPSAGRIFIGDRDVTSMPPNRRDAGMVFQTYALFPHMTVAQNIAFGLKMRGIRGSEKKQRVADALRLVQLESFADRLPRQLSGGQQQRVALARAVVIRPRVLLMDEPLGALDLKLRQDLQIQIRAVQQELGITTIYVTHDQGEALSMSDRVAVMRGGRIEQLDTPEGLYGRPCSSFVANFVGRTNLMHVRILGESETGNCYHAEPIGSEKRLIVVPKPAADIPVKPGAEFVLGFRPENSHLGAGRTNSLRARVEDIRYFGSTRTISLTCGSMRIEVDQQAIAPAPGKAETVDITWDPEESFLLPREIDAPVTPSLVAPIR